MRYQLPVTSYQLPATRNQEPHGSDWRPAPGSRFVGFFRTVLSFPFPFPVTISDPNCLYRFNIIRYATIQGQTRPPISGGCGGVPPPLSFSHTPRGNHNLSRTRR